MVAIIVLCSIAVAVSTRLGQLMTLVVTVGLFMLGLLSDWIFGRNIARIEENWLTLARNQGLTTSGGTHPCHAVDQRGDRGDDADHRRRHRAHCWTFPVSPTVKSQPGPSTGSATASCRTSRSSGCPTRSRRDLMIPGDYLVDSIIYGGSTRSRSSASASSSSSDARSVDESGDSTAYDGHRTSIVNQQHKSHPDPRRARTQPRFSRRGDSRVIASWS